MVGSFFAEMVHQESLRRAAPGYHRHDVGTRQLAPAQSMIDPGGLRVDGAEEEGLAELPAEIIARLFAE